MTDTITLKPSRLSKPARERIPAHARSRKTFEQAALDLEAAADSIEQGPWRQGTIGDPTSGMCAIGHLSIATGATRPHGAPKYPGSIGGVWSDNAFRHALAAAIAELEVPKKKFDHDIVNFNDCEGTTREDVAAMLRRAARRARRYAAWYKR